MKEKVFAWTSSGTVSLEAFHSAIEALSTNLPQQAPLLNTSEDRYQFALLLAAGWINQCPTLLPSDRGRDQLERLKLRYPGVHNLGSMTVPDAVPAPSDAFMGRFKVPMSQGDAVIPFTSGTTGDPVSHPKSMQELKASASLIDQHLGGSEGIRLVATVPPQHMYGLELSVLLPLFCGAILDFRRPFFPSDITEALRDGPGPVALITTPLHLGALLDSGFKEVPDLAFIVTATAPLDIERALEAEKRLKAPLYEIYGCTELGSIAGRRPVIDPCWRWFEGVRCQTTPEGITVEASHMREPARISDHLEILPDSGFRLVGRARDLVNIAGKRTSIASLESATLKVPGVRDVAFVINEGAGILVPRLSALFVLDPGVTLEDVRLQLRQLLDPAFVPRTMRLVDRLPRNPVGKLPRASLMQMFAATEADAND